MAVKSPSWTDILTFIAYNQSADVVNRLDTSIFEQEGVTEEFRRLEARLRVTGFTRDGEHPGHPIISFGGVVNPPSNSTMSGRVRLTSDNHLKWTFVSVQHVQVAHGLC